jgi:putative ABC transport system permease protein
LNRIFAALRDLFRRDHIERDLDAEIRGYAELLQEGKMSQGMNPIEARRAARMDLGGPEQLKEEIRAARAGAWLESLWQDLRFGARMLRRNPGFTAVAILTLALGIGANTAVFSIVDTIILNPFPYKDASHLVLVHANTKMFPGFQLGLSWISFDQVRRDVPAFEQTSAYFKREETLTGEDVPAILQAVRVSDGFFEELAQTPQVGRLLEPQDQSPGQDRVAVLSDALWRTRFGADRGVVGRAVVLDKKTFTVVGVAARHFEYPEGSDLWIPLNLSADARQNPTSFNLETLGKSRNGVTLVQAQAQLDIIADRVTHSYPELKDGYRLPAESLVSSVVQNIQSAYWILFAAATLVLLIACTNIASLLLARGWARQRELALRAALGASRLRLLRQIMTESCLVALFGAAIGLILSVGGVKLFQVFAPAGTPRLAAVSINTGMVRFAIASAVFAGIVCGIAPALRASRLDPNSTIHEGSLGGRGSTSTIHQLRIGNLMVVVEVSLAFLLLIGAVLTAEDLIRVLRVDPGFRTDHLLTMDLPNSGPATKDDVVTSELHLSQMLDRIRQLPGVQSAEASDSGVLNNRMMMHSNLRFEGELPPSQRQGNDFLHARMVTPGYFQLLGVPLLRGRYFSNTDVRGGKPVAIVNESLAKARWGTMDVLGKRMSISTDEENHPIWNEIVGVVADTRDVGLDSRPSSEYYLSLLQVATGSTHLMIRTARDPESLAGAASLAVWSVSPDQPITHVQSLTRTISKSLGEPRMRAALLGLFAGLGLILALIGVFGVVSYTVMRRTREIGIRVAMGAQRAGIFGMVIRQALVLAMLGIALGTAAGMALSKIIAAQLVDVKSTDPATYIVTGLLMIIVTCLACYVPARRAMRVDPMVALRHE